MARSSGVGRVLLIAAGVLYCHLLRATGGAVRRLQWTVGVLWALAFFFGALQHYSSSREFSSTPSFESSLKLPLFAAAPAESLDEFINGTAGLQERVERLRRRHDPAQPGVGR